jgi:hypothetical protein
MHIALNDAYSDNDTSIPPMMARPGAGTAVSELTQEELFE